MLDQEKEPEDGVDGRLFLHVSTGRFLRRRLPSFGFGRFSSYILVCASDGLLVLGDDKGLHAARLLNPFTGDMLPFAAPIPREPWMVTSVAGSSPTLLFSFEDKCNVYCADATSQLCQVQFQGWEHKEFFLRSQVSYAGDLYMVSYDGGIHKIVGTAPNYQGELVGTQDLVKVFRVNIDRKVLEPVRNIGSRALFLGARCLSVDADKLPSVDRNCIYYADDPETLRGCYSISRYDLNDSKVESSLRIGSWNHESEDPSFQPCSDAL